MILFTTLPLNERELSGRALRFTGWCVWMNRFSCRWMKRKKKILRSVFTQILQQIKLRFTIYDLRLEKLKYLIRLVKTFSASSQRLAATRLQSAFQPYRPEFIFFG